MRPDTGSSTAVEFTLDTIPPAVSITTAGGLTNKASQTISGTVTASEAPVGATVTPIGSATVVSGGAWSATVTLSGDGTHSITAQDTDTAGNTGSSGAVVFTLDTIPPTVAISTSGGLTNKASQTISGTVTASEAPVGATVSLYDNGSTTLIGTATVVSGGGWSTAVTLSGDGTHSIVARSSPQGRVEKGWNWGV